MWFSSIFFDDGHASGADGAVVCCFKFILVAMDLSANSEIPSTYDVQRTRKEWGWGEGTAMRQWAYYAERRICPSPYALP